MSYVICHMSHVTGPSSHVMFFFVKFFDDEVVELVDGVYVINGAYAIYKKKILINRVGGCMSKLVVCVRVAKKYI